MSLAYSFAAIQCQKYAMTIKKHEMWQKLENMMLSEKKKKDIKATYSIYTK